MEHPTSEDMYLRRGAWRKVAMDHGPVDFIVVCFPGTQFSPEVASGIRSLTDAGTIRIIDLLFLLKDADGAIEVKELADLDDAAYEEWEPAVGDVFGYLTDDDAMLLADSLASDSSAALVLVENTWARDMVQTIAAAHGDVLISERIPRPVVEHLVMNHQVQPQRAWERSANMLRRRRPAGQRGPGLARTVGRTAVVAGTATAVSGSVAARQAAAQQQVERQQLADLQQQVNQLRAQDVQAQMAPPTGVAGAGEDLLGQLTRLGELHQQGILSAEEFAAAKAKLLGLQNGEAPASVVRE